MVLRKRRLHRASLSLLFLLFLFAHQEVVSTTPAFASAPQEIEAIRRNLEPVVITGVFVGVPASEIYLYRFAGGSWQPIPYQIDQVVSGEYQSGAVTNLDADDEIAFMVSDLGELATTPIDEDISIRGQWYQVEVTNPLVPTEKGYAYIVRSSDALTRSTEDYVAFDAGTRRATSDDYVVGWSNVHSGLEHISLFGGSNLLDRTKLRVTFRAGGSAPQQITEQTTVPALELIKDGPVRVIVSRGSVISICYPHHLRTVLNVDLSNIPLLTVENVRSSTDLANTVTAAYYNENTAAGATIDGTADTVAETPINDAWRQISHSSGTMIQVTDLSSLGGFPGHYYKDDSTVDPADTGDQQSYGDSGFKIVNPSGNSFTLDSNLYFLAGSQPNRGDEFSNIYASPLGVVNTLQGEPETDGKLFMPFARKQQ